MVFVYSLFVVVIMLVLNAVFAAYEMALAAVSHAKLQILRRENRFGSQEAIFMKEKIEGSLAVIQLGITFAGVIAAAVGGAGSDEEIAPYLADRFRLSAFYSELLALVVFIIPLGVITIVFGELVPKTIALKNKEWVCLKLSPVMKILYCISFPVVAFLEKTVRMITEKGSKKIVGMENFDTPSNQELKIAASLARASRLIGIQEEKIVHSAAELSMRPVKDIIIPAAEISIIPAGLSLTEVLIRAHLDMHTRFPVCAEENNPQTITGYINFKDIIYILHTNPANPGLQSIIRPMKSFNADVRISVVMEEMIRDGLHISLVKDSRGVTIGMITLEDILEELVGEILDEYDRLPTYINQQGNGWVIGGGVSLEKVAQVTGKALGMAGIQEATAIKTFAQWCRYIKKGALKGAESFEQDGLSITIRKFRRKQVLEAFVTVRGVL